MRSGILKME